MFVLYASTEDRLLIALSPFELLGMYSAEVRWSILRIIYAYTYILRTRLTRQSAICARKNQAQFIIGCATGSPVIMRSK